MQSLGIVASIILLLLIDLTLAATSTIPITNCAKMSLDNLKCEYCNSGYYLNKFSTTCTVQEAQDKYCIQKYDKICIRCDCGYLIVSDKNTCAKATYELRGCEVINPRQQCIRPKKDYVISQVGNDIVVRYSRGSNCEVETDTYVCLQCHSGYKLDSNRNCIKVDKKIDNIYYSYFYGDELKSRSSLYVAGNYGVYPPIKYCNEHTGQENDKVICTKCIDGMITNREKTACYVSPCDFCKYATEETVNSKTQIKCIECENSNYFFVYTLTALDNTFQQSCAPRSNHLFDNCVDRNPQYDSCNKCIDSFSNPPSDKYCVLKYWKQITYQKSTSNLYGCKVMLNSTQCQECSKGFLLLNGSCEVAPSNCIEMISNPNKECKTCSNLYYLSNKICTPLTNPLNCVISQGLVDKCFQCQSLYYPDSNGICVSLTIPANCQYSKGKQNQCDKCENLYYLNSGQCKMIDDYLRCVISEGILNECIVCRQNFILDTNKKCINNSNSVDCLKVPGQYFNSICDIQTFTNWDQCLVQDPAKNECIQCTNTYYWDTTNKQCLKTSNSCYTDGKIANCKVCQGLNEFVQANACSSSTCQNTNGIIDICTNCQNGADSGYFDQNSQHCIINSTDSNCINFKNPSTSGCYLCKNKYYPNPSNLNICEPFQDNNCLFSDGQQNSSIACILCQQGYVKDANGKCQLKTIAQCKDNNQSYCSLCENKYYVSTSTGLCLPIQNPTCDTSDGVKDSCVTCQADYNFIDSDYLNYCGFPFCKTKNSQNPQKGCLECQAGYYLTKNGQCRYITIDNCLEQISDQECTKCQDTFYLVQMNYGGVICQKIDDQLLGIKNCVKGNGQDYACVECQAGFYLTSYGTCLQISNCIDVVKELGICKQCVFPSNPPLIISNDQTQCIQLDNCQSSDDGKVCTQCSSSGYYIKIVDGQITCELIRNCKTSNGVDKTCTACIDGYKLQDGQCWINNQIDNCEFYNSNNTCKKCQSNFYLTNQKCLQISNSQTCQESDGISNTCTTMDVFNIPSLNFDNCYIVENINSNTQSCKYCKLNFFIDNTNKCFSKSTTITDCQLYNFSTNSNCYKCLSLYYQNGSTCALIDTNADCVYSNGNLSECLNCKRMKFLKKQGSDYKCLTMGRNNIKQGCLKYDSKEVCEKCVPNHYLSGTGGCLPRTIFDNCKEYNPTADECIKCQPDFYLTEDPQFPFGQIKFCKIVPRGSVVLNCIEYEKQGTNIVCTKCSNSGQYADLQEYYLNSNKQCQDIVEKQCSSYDGTNCKKSVFNCQQYTTNQDKCEICKIGYYLSADQLKCTKHTNVANCFEYDPLKDECKTCDNLYLRSNPLSCIKITNFANCQISKTNGPDCILCMNDYSLNQSGICQLNTGKYCTKLQSDGIKCQDCNEGYAREFDQIKCISYTLSVPNCKYLKERDPLKQNKLYYQCDQCADSYYYSEGQNQCLPQESLCSIPNCQIYDTNDSHLDYYFCKECDKTVKDYYLDQVARCSFDTPEPISDSDNLPDPIISEENGCKLRFSILFTILAFIIFY